MLDKLKPCPFYGEKAHLFVNEGVRVICPSCGASTRILVDSMSSRGVTGNATQAALNAWNKRASLTENRKEQENETITN